MSLHKRLQEIFSPERLTKILPYYEDRPEQRALANVVFDSFQKNAACLIEAGTGTGKSLGYLLPAILWALETGERVIISTHTIPLQEQLIKKEIPLALKILDAEIGVALAKGMTNYLCEMKLFHSTQETSFLQDSQEKTFQRVLDWSKTQKEPVTKSDLPVYMNNETWHKLQADIETCTGARCPYFSSCHFFRSRKALQEVKLIVVNHHLLLNDLSQRVEKNNWEGTCVLPSYSRIIIDEAHHLEEVALNLFQIKVQRFDHLHLIRQFAKEGSFFSVEKTVLFKLMTFIHEDTRLFEADYKLILLRHIESEIVHQAHKIEKTSENFFEAIFSVAQETSQQKKNIKQEEFGLYKEGRFRITVEVSNTPQFQKSINSFQDHERAVKVLDAACEELFHLFQDKGITIATSSEKKAAGTSSEGPAVLLLKTLLYEIVARRDKLLKQIQDLKTCFSSIENPEKVVWIEWAQTKMGGIEIRYVTSAFDVGKELRQHVFDPMATSILLSATLTTKDTFNFAKERLGLSFFEKETSSPLFEAIYPSPFPYKENALLAIAEDMVSSDHPKYYHELENTIFSIAQGSKGGVLVLFTSYSTLEIVYPKVHEKLSKIGLLPMKQGDMSRTQLLEALRASQNGVLFATDSFWEGVDIPGSALRCVVITKLPFDVPSDPIYQARHEALEKKGISSFMHYALPRAVVKFKQAFGRLIRRSTDYGVVVCLDSRLSQKQYGQSFLKSIPDCQIWKGKVKDISSIVQSKM